jgi:hypothetical protein
MFNNIKNVFNSILIVTLLSLSYIETLCCKKIFIFNQMLKNQIIRSGPVPVKIAQFIINYKNIEYYNNKPAYLVIYNDLFNNVYKNKIPHIENYKLLNSGSICAVYLNNNDNTILKKLHYKSIDSVNFYLSLIGNLFYLFSIPINYNDFKAIFLKQFNIEFESSMHNEFYNKVDNKLIKIPKIIINNETEIIMEYLPSKSFNSSDLSYKNTTKYSNILSIFFKQMYVENGLLHLDMHDGNWGLTDDGIVVYDFGYSLKLFDCNDEAEKKLFHDVLFYSRPPHFKHLITIIFTNFISPSLIDYNDFYNFIGKINDEYDKHHLLVDLIKYCKKNNYKINIKLYYIFSSFSILRSLLEHIFNYNTTDFKDSSRDNILCQKLIHENAILYQNQHYNTTKLWNNKIIQDCK